MPKINMQTFEEVRRHQLVTEFNVQSQSELVDYQVKLENVDNPTQAQDNLVVGVDGRALPHWNESVDFDTWIKMDIGTSGKRSLLIHGNSGLSSGSSISDMGVFGEDFSGDLSKWSGTTGAASITDGVVTMSQNGTWRAIWSTQQFDNDIIFEYLGYISIGGYNILGFGNGAHSVDEYGGFEYHVVSGVNLDVGKDGTDSRTSSDWTTDSWKRQTIKWVGSTMYFYEDRVQAQNSPYGPYDLSTEQIGVALHSHSAEPKLEWVFVRKYTATEPTYTIGTPKNISTALKSFGRAG